MAKAIKTEASYEVTLTLSQVEAETLLAVLHRVGGHPDSTSRKLTDTILYALRGIGVNKIDVNISQTHASIWFV